MTSDHLPCEVRAVDGVSDATLAPTTVCEEPKCEAVAVCRGSIRPNLKNRARRPDFVLAELRDGRYTSLSRPVGPLPQGMLTSAGFLLRGGRP